EALERLGLLTVMLDRDGRVQYVSAHTSAVVGYSQEELLGKDWMGLVLPAEVVAVVRPRFQEVMDEPFVDLRDERETDLITRGGASAGARSSCRVPTVAPAGRCRSGWILRRSAGRRPSSTRRTRWTRSGAWRAGSSTTSTTFCRSC